MSSAKDFRGVQRADCSQCICAQYNGGTEGKKCVDCGHPPGKHRNAVTGSIYVPQSVLPQSTATVSSYSPGMDMDTDGVCKHPGCSSSTYYDLNTGLQDDYCGQHTSVTTEALSLPQSQALQSLLPQPGSFDSIIYPFQHPATANPTGFHLPVQVAVPPDKQCKLPGCTRKKFTEPSGRVHDFCRRGHAQEYAKQNTQIPAELQCKTSGCYRQRYPNDQGGYFDFCSQYCRDNGTKPATQMLASASTPNIALASNGPCKFPKCTKTRYRDPANGRLHDYCGRTHAYEARMQGIAGDTVNIRVTTSQEQTTIVRKFQQAWAPGKGQCPPVAFVFIITNSVLLTRWTKYRNGLQKKQIEEYYHGTKLTCNITAKSALCTDTNCGACGISNTGFDRRCIRKNINFQRFGHGFYLAPNSSKCHDYTQGSHTYRAMILFDVCPGNKYNLKKGDQTLKGPPQGFDSVYGQTGQDLNYEELVVYNPDAALPKYIIVYQKGGEGKIAN